MWQHHTHLHDVIVAKADCLIFAIFDACWLLIVIVSLSDFVDKSAEACNGSLPSLNHRAFMGWGFFLHGAARLACKLLRQGYGRVATPCSLITAARRLVIKGAAPIAKSETHLAWYCLKNYSVIKKIVVEIPSYLRSFGSQMNRSYYKCDVL